MSWTGACTDLISLRRHVTFVREQLRNSTHVEGKICEARLIETGNPRIRITSPATSCPKCLNEMQKPEHREIKQIAAAISDRRP